MTQIYAIWSISDPHHFSYGPYLPDLSAECANLPRLTGVVWRWAQCAFCGTAAAAKHPGKARQVFADLVAKANQVAKAQ